MGLHSYSQPSSSECDLDLDLLLLEAEADASSNHNNLDAGSYSPQSKCDEGIPKTCYCGSLPTVATSYTSKDPGRRYFSCENVEDGDYHIWKWWDVAVMEELSEFERRLREVTDQGKASEHKLVEIEKTMEVLVKKKSWVVRALPLLLCAMLFIAMVVMFKRLEERENVLSHCLDELKRLKMGVPDV